LVTRINVFYAGMWIINIILKPNKNSNNRCSGNYLHSSRYCSNNLCPKYIHTLYCAYSALSFDHTFLKPTKCTLLIYYTI
jgi:hypothetical protein